MADAAGLVQYEPPALPVFAQPHAGKAPQASGIRHVARASGLTRKVQPVQRRPAARFEIRLIPHSAKFGWV